jgi:hypothetical protein
MATLIVVVLLLLAGITMLGARAMAEAAWLAVVQPTQQLIDAQSGS